MLLSGLIVIAVASVVGVAIYRQGSETSPSLATTTPQTTVAPTPTANPSRSPAPITPTTVALPPPTGQKAVHQQLIKDFVACVKNNEVDCHCKYGSNKTCAGLTADLQAKGLVYSLIPYDYREESSTDLLEDITRSYRGKFSCNQLVVYRTRDVVNAVDREAIILYEDGTWKLPIAHYDECR